MNHFTASWNVQKPNTIVTWLGEMRITPRPCGKKVLHRSPKNVLPDHTTINSLTYTFGKYFADNLVSTNDDPLVPGSYKNKFVSFRTMSDEDVLQIINSTPN